MLRRSRRQVRFRRRHGLGVAGIAAAFAIALLLFAFGRAGSGAPDAGTAPTARPGATTLAATAQPPSGVPIALIQPDPSQLQPASVLRVIDGDTIVVDIAGSKEHVRYYGIDTTERGQPCYQEAKDRNAQLIGTSVLLLPDARDRDRYDRLLRYVFDASGASVDAQLVGEGLAHAWREDGTYRDALVAGELAAQEAGVGCLWSTEAR